MDGEKHSNRRKIKIKKKKRKNEQGRYDLNPILTIL